jgi:hypothetical protein
VRYYASFLNDGETHAYNIASNQTAAKTFLQNDAARVFQISITDADLSGRGLFNFYFQFESLVDNNNYLCGVALSFTEDHAGV